MEAPVYGAVPERPGGGKVYMDEHREQSLNPELIESGLHAGSIFRGKIFCHPAVDSTNTRALARAEAGDPEGCVFLADEQTGGRGKPGRVWYSRAGEGLYMSVLLRPPVPPARVPLLTLMAAVTVVEALSPALGLSNSELRTANCELPHLDIKWPNDVLLNGRKLCGILSEMAMAGERVLHAVVGIGLNVHQAHFPPPLDALATSLFLELGRHVGRARLAAGILNAFETWYIEFLQGRFDRILTRWGNLSTYTRGRPVTVEKNGERLTGITGGLDAYGALLVERPGGALEVISAGDILSG